MKKASRVSPNSWGDSVAAIAVRSAFGKREPVARPGPAENPPTPAMPVRQHFKMAGGR